MDAGKSTEHFIAALSLRALPGVGDRGYKLLIDAFGSPGRALTDGARVLSGRGDGCENLARLLRKNPDRAGALKILEDSEKVGCRILCYGDPDYPEPLSHIHDPPAQLYVLGKFASLSSVAIVGSRKATTFARRTARMMARELAAANLTVVSGFAHGVDTEAHRGALEGAGHTVAVLGSGVDVIYPRRNTELAGKVLAAGGAIISEHPPGVEPLPRHFPRRNRVISGLSLGVVVVEAARRSGSLITAKTALEQGREVFAVPGLAGSSSSEGTHNLIRQGAVLAESAKDILHEIERRDALVGPVLKGGVALRPCKADEVVEAAGIDETPDCLTAGSLTAGGLTAAADVATVSLPARKSEPKPVATPEAGDAVKMLDVLEEAPLDIETLINRSQLTAGAASAALMELVLIGRAQEWPGKLYCKLN